jgi:hypothetical protein
VPISVSPTPGDPPTVSPTPGDVPTSAPITESAVHRYGDDELFTYLH